MTSCGTPFARAGVERIFQLLDLAPGAVEAVRRRVIADQLGHDVATELGLIDREAQAEARRARSPRAKDADVT